MAEKKAGIVFECARFHSLTLVYKPEIIKRDDATGRSEKVQRPVRVHFHKDVDNVGRTEPITDEKIVEWVREHNYFKGGYIVERATDAPAPVPVADKVQTGTIGTQSLAEPEAPANDVPKRRAARVKVGRKKAAE